MEPTEQFLFVAVHKGPYLSIKPLADLLGSGRAIYLLDGVSLDEVSKLGPTKSSFKYLDLSIIEREYGSIREFMLGSRVKAVVRSTSEGVPTPNVEDLATAAANLLNIPVFVIEDFPGNYWPKASQRIDGLFVEDHSQAEIHRHRGVPPQSIFNTGNPRYDVLHSVDVDSERARHRKALGLAGQRVMLWAGQPDGDNSYNALERLLTGLKGNKATLLFRAHPRDPLYGAGKYQGFLECAAVDVVDVSSYPDATGLYCASDLVATQFSSAGVEASHLGVPVLWVLFDDLGKTYLRNHKGYDALPWHQDLCGFLVEDQEDVTAILNEALFDDSARERVQENFQKRFWSGRNSARAIADVIINLLIKDVSTMSQANLS